MINGIDPDSNRELLDIVYDEKMFNDQRAIFDVQQQKGNLGAKSYQSSVLNEETGNPSVLNNSPMTKSLKA